MKKKEEKKIVKKESQPIAPAEAKAEILFCRKCGNKLNKDAVFCDKCGNFRWPYYGVNKPEFAL